MIHERDGRTDGQTDGETPHDDIGRAYASHRAAKITVIVKGQFARQDETVSSRLKFVSLAFNS